MLLVLFYNCYSVTFSAIDGKTSKVGILLIKRRKNWVRSVFLMLFCLALIFANIQVFLYCLCLGSLSFMAYSDFVNLLLAVAVWCTAYITVAVVASFRAVNYLCTF